MPAAARPAASVLLVRPAPVGTGCEVFVLHRSATMAFAAGMVAFPGGAREPGDADARACAVRELAEETGVRVAPAELVAWDRWITPETLPIRYDTEFFLATMPTDQTARCVTPEADHGEWVAPYVALAEIAAGRWRAFPPTRALLTSLSDVASTAELADLGRHRGVRHLLAPNPGPMTLSGTNTWLVPTGTGLVVIDPGPCDNDHLQGILGLASDLERRIELIVLTHRHHDHVDLAPALADATGAAIRAADPTLCRDAGPLADGESLPGGLTVVATPGHTDDSICLLHPGQRVLFTGDTVLGQGSSVIMYGDGSVTDSLASLARLVALTEQHQVDRILPGHGPEVLAPQARLRHDLAHRHERIAQVRSALDRGLATVTAVTEQVHAGLDPRLVPAARTSIAAHLAHLDALSAEDPWLAAPAAEQENS